MSQPSLLDIANRSLELFQKHASTPELWDERVANKGSKVFSTSEHSPCFRHLSSGNALYLYNQNKYLVELLEPYEEERKQDMPPTTALDTEATIKHLRAEVECLHVQLAGCGVAALGDTWKFLALNSICKGSYGWSDSYGQVVRMMKKLLLARDHIEHLERLVKEAGLLTESDLEQLRKDYTLKGE